MKFFINYIIPVKEKHRKLSSNFTQPTKNNANEKTLRMQTSRVRQKIHHSVLPQKTYYHTPIFQDVCVCNLLQIIRSRTVLKGTYLHSHRLEALQMPI